ncbi:RNA recognition motif domain-containing protein [Bryobacter aggregatus]|uniref:RNA recognition motif domain-containing protein n=1 Tax=Bryobacter aggregatus TaxID=360054 RepID=UPI0004E28617|nr:RNA-binding protein [Bryobacter aggregatus]
MTNLYVGNLSFHTTEDQLMGIFQEFGAVERVNVVTDRMTGQPRGFAFVEMTNRNEAENAISGLDGRELDGRNLTVNEARPKTDGPRGGGRPGGGGGRPGGGGGRPGGGGGGFRKGRY